MSGGTVVDELLVALRHVEDLDNLQTLVASSDTMDRYSPPLRDWMLQLVNCERRRRETGGDDEYPIAVFENWPVRWLVQNANLAGCIVEAAIIHGDPAIVNFSLRLLQLLVGLVGLALLHATEPRR
jgi:hypothetical protein